MLEGYGMTETATAATFSTEAEFRFGTVGRALPGAQIRIADDGEILIKGPNIFQGYHNHIANTFGDIEDGWLHTGDLGSLDEDGYLSITGRKKDIIITAGGKNLTPANMENDLKQCRWISQAVMYGDRRPYPVVLVTLDEEEIPIFASQHDLPQDIPSLAREPKVRELIQAEIDRANEKYAQVEQVKKFVILDHDLTQATGELTPTLKVKRNVVNEKYSRDVRRSLLELTLGPAPQLRTIEGRHEERSIRHRRPVRGAPSRHGAAHYAAPPERGGEARQRVDSSLGGLPVRRHGVRQPALLGPDPDRLPVGRLAGRVPLQQREHRHPVRLHRPRRAAVRRADGARSAWTTPGSSCAAPPATTSARERSGASSRATAAICAIVFAFWFVVIHGPGSVTVSGNGT